MQATVHGGRKESDTTERFHFTWQLMRLSRWLSSKKICLPIQELQETQVQSLGQEDPLEEDMATHFSILAWRIPWTEEPGSLQSLGS